MNSRRLVGLLSTVMIIVGVALLTTPVALGFSASGTEMMSSGQSSASKGTATVAQATSKPSSTSVPATATATAPASKIKPGALTATATTAPPTATATQTPSKVKNEAQSAGPAGSIQYTLEGQTKSPQLKYTTGDVKGWAEGECIPFRLTIDHPVSGTIQIDFDNLNGGIVGIVGLENVQVTSGGSGTVTGSGTFQSGGVTIGYIRFSLTATGDPAVIAWCARLGNKASQWPGSSIHVSLHDVGEKTVPIITNGIISVQTYSISGMKFNDLNGNGSATPDVGEPGLAGWVIQLSKNGTVISTTTTVTNGSYSFPGLASGTYTVSEVLQTGWVQTYPNSPNYHTINLSANTQNVNFGNRQPPAPTFSISGMKFNDLDGNSRRDEGEPGLSGWTINLSNNGTVISTTTASDGSYSFSGLVSGTYTVTETSQNGWTQTYPSGGSHVVTVGPSTTGKDFGNWQPPAATPTSTPTDIPVPPDPTSTPTSTPTDVPVPPEATSTPTPTPTDVPVPPGATSTPTSTPTDVPVPPAATSTPTSTPTDVPVPPGATSTPTPTPTSVSTTPTTTSTVTSTSTSTSGGGGGGGGGGGQPTQPPPSPTVPTVTEVLAPTPVSTPIVQVLALEPEPDPEPTEGVLAPAVLSFTGDPLPLDWLMIYGLSMLGGGLVLRRCVS